MKECSQQRDAAGEERKKSDFGSEVQRQREKEKRAKGFFSLCSFKNRKSWKLIQKTPTDL